MKSNNFFTIIDTDKIKIYLESLGLEDSKNIISYITRAIQKKIYLNDGEKLFQIFFCMEKFVIMTDSKHFGKEIKKWQAIEKNKFMRNWLAYIHFDCIYSLYLKFWIK